jgi:hypothetical protein
MCFLFPYKFCLKSLSLQEEFGEVLSQMYIGLHVKYQLSGQTLINLNFQNISEKYSNAKFNKKIRPVGQRSMRTDKRTDRHDETNGHFSQLCRRA